MDNLTPLPQTYDVPTPQNIAYPVWKKAAIEGTRTFVMAFLAVIVAQLQLGIDLTNWRNDVPPLILAAMAAGIKAIVKWARETYGADYSNWLFKLPL